MKTKEIKRKTNKALYVYYTRWEEKLLLCASQYFLSVLVTQFALLLVYYNSCRQQKQTLKGNQVNIVTEAIYSLRTKTRRIEPFH